MVAVASGVLGFLHSIRRPKIRERFYLLGLLQTAANVVALAIDGGIDLVSHAVIAFVFGKANVVGSCTRPDLVAVPGERRLPNAEMMAARDHRDRLRHFVAEILPPPEQVQG